MPDLAIQMLELIDANIAEIKAKVEREEISYKTCEERTDKLQGLRDQVIKEMVCGKYGLS